MPFDDMTPEQSAFAVCLKDDNVTDGGQVFLFLSLISSIVPLSCVPFKAAYRVLTGRGERLNWRKVGFCGSFAKQGERNSGKETSWYLRGERIQHTWLPGCCFKKNLWKTT